MTEQHELTTVIGQMYGKLPARDVERAKAFSADKLGLTPFGERHNHLYYEVVLAACAPTT